VDAVGAPAGVGVILAPVGYYTDAAVCRRGHVATSVISAEKLSPKCARCGAVVITNCAPCGNRIRGRWIEPGVINMGQTYAPPPFCDQCGSPHPWAGREARIYELQNLLDEEQLGPAEELVVHEQLTALLNPELDEKEQLKRWKRIREAAPDFLLKTASQPIVVSLITGVARKELGLPPT
jgi:hypothetical protein